MSTSDPSRSVPEPSDGPSPVETRRLIDRLVDDELSPAERRALVARFERSPELWRTCALAFLENQAFRGDFGAFRGAFDGPRGEAPTPPKPSCLPGESPAPAKNEPAPGSAAPTVAPARPVAPPETPRRARPAMFTSSGWSALAAGVLLSFSIGAAAGPWAQQRFFGSGDPPPASSSGSGEVASKEPASAPINLYDLTLAGDGVGGGSTKLSVPVVEAPGWDENMLRSLPSAVSPDARKQIESLGETLGEERRLMPVVLSNGQTVLIPVDQIRVRPRVRPLQ